MKAQQQSRRRASAGRVPLPKIAPLPVVAAAVTPPRRPPSPALPGVVGGGGASFRRGMLGESLRTSPASPAEDNNTATCSSSSNDSCLARLSSGGVVVVEGGAAGGGGGGKVARHDTPRELCGLMRLHEHSAGVQLAKFMLRRGSGASSTSSGSIGASSSVGCSDSGLPTCLASADSQQQQQQRRRSTIVEVRVEPLLARASSPSTPRSSSSATSTPRALDLLKRKRLSGGGSSGDAARVASRSIIHSASGAFTGIDEVAEIDDSVLLLSPMHDPSALVFAFLRPSDQRSLRATCTAFVDRFNDAVRAGSVAFAGSRDLLADTDSCSAQWAPLAPRTSCTAFLRTLALSTDAQPKLLDASGSSLVLDTRDSSRFQQLQSIIFAHCSALESIGDGFLSGAPKLEFVNAIGPSSLASLVTIGSDFMSGCASMREVAIPFGALAVPLSLQSAASGMPALEVIGCNFLAGCGALKTATLRTLPELRIIGGRFLAACPALRVVELGATPKLSSINNGFITGAVMLERLRLPPSLPRLRMLGTDFLSLRTGTTPPASAASSGGNLTKLKGPAAAAGGNGGRLESLELPSMPRLKFVLGGFMARRVATALRCADGGGGDSGGDTLLRLVRDTMSDAVYDEWKSGLTVDAFRQLVVSLRYSPR